MGKFTRSDIRKILGEAHTDEIENALMSLHLGVVDPLKDDLEKYKADAEKLAGVQKELDTLKAGKDWKAEHDKLKKEFDDYKADVTSKETLGKVKAAYRKLLDEKKIGKEDGDLIMLGTKFDGMKLTDDGKLDGADKLAEEIGTKYARYIPTTDTRGAKVETPPAGNSGTGANPRAAELAKAFNDRRYGPVSNDKKE